MKKKVVVAGLGDTGVLVAIHLSKKFDVLAISPKPALVSGQELGTRLARPETWKQDYLVPFHRYRKLDNVRILQAQVTAIHGNRNVIAVKDPDGNEREEHYDALLIASGVTNGFWRNSKLESLADIESQLERASAELANADTIAIIGGGVAGVSAASNLKEQFPEKQVHLFHSQDQPLPGYHPKVKAVVADQLEGQGVCLHPNHRAKIPQGFQCDRFSEEPIEWEGGQPSFDTDLALWTIGNVKPNNEFIPKEMLNENGFVIVDKHLRVPNTRNVFSVGDIAATDPARSSARNAGFLIAAHNIRALLGGRESKMKAYKASPYRWGSVLGVQQNGMRVFTPTGGSIRIAKSLVRKVLFPFFVGKLMYKGMRKAK